MEKKLSDYLHLYIGGPMWHISPAGNHETKLSHWLYKDLIDGHLASFAYYKLMLRPLSSMTEEEMKEIVLMNYNVENTLLSVIQYSRGIEFKTSGFTGGGEIDFYKTNPITFLHLLSKHFDLFGLIEAGIAIDKTKHPSP